MRGMPELTVYCAKYPSPDSEKTEHRRFGQVKARNCLQVRGKFKEGIAMLQKLLLNKNVVIGITFILSLCLFTAITVVDYIYRLSDYTFYSKSIVSIIDKSFKSEIEYLNRRNKNYMNAVISEKNIAALVSNKNVNALKQIYDPIYINFRHRLVPVILFTITDANGHILYRASDVAIDVGKKNRISGTLKHVLERKQFVSGFESDFLPFWYNIGIPIIDRKTNQLVGAIEVGLDPEWFQFKFGWFFEGVKSAIVVKDPTKAGCKPENNAALCYRFIDKTIAPLKDVQFFSSVLPDLNMESEFSEIKMGKAHYLVSTSQRFQNHDGEEAGRFLVAYDMTTFKKKQWEYLYTRLMFFLPAIALLLSVIYIGFRKHEKIINEKNRQLAQKSKNCALGEMLGYIGHQWRQPLHTLSMVIQNIELQSGLGQLDDQLIKSQVALANKNINYMSTIIEDWRSLLMSGSSRQLIDLAESVNRAITIVNPVMERSDIKIENRISGSIKTMGFVNDLVQLSVNVLLNAKDQLCIQESERLILLTCQETGDVVTVRFHDNAGGIPKHLLTRIFEPYVTTKDASNGTGLGLYLCSQIAENLENGRVWAENNTFECNGKNYFGACICLQFSKVVGKVQT